MWFLSLHSCWSSLFKLLFHFSLFWSKNLKYQDFNWLAAVPLTSLSFCKKLKRFFISLFFLFFLLISSFACLVPCCWRSAAVVLHLSLMTLFLRLYFLLHCNDHYLHHCPTICRFKGSFLLHCQLHFQHFHHLQLLFTDHTQFTAVFINQRTSFSLCPQTDIVSFRIQTPDTSSFIHTHTLT